MGLTSAGDLFQAAPQSHPFFSIHELCQKFAAALKGDYGNLFNLACVSRTLSDVALDELWSEVHGLDQLITLLPQDAYQFNSEDSDNDNDDDSIVSTYCNLLPVPWLIASSSRL